MKSQSPTRLPFDLSTIAEVFDIQKKRKCKVLEAWIHSSYQLSTVRQSLLDEVYEKSRDDMDYWNEEELKMHLISHLFYAADIVVAGKIAVYFERRMEKETNNHLLSVICDCMVATPKPFNKPAAPYFFLQEFKKGKSGQIDPEAQMLIAMLIAQHQNKDGKPIYGSYVIGRHWYFTTLLGNQYCQANPFDATIKKDLYQIVYVLRALKDLILSRL